MKSIYSNTITGIIHILSAAAIYLLLNTGCDLLESNKSSNNLQLTVSETSCTEAWLSLKTNQLSLPQEISLIQNEKERETFNLTKRDTLLYFASLQPNKSYKFKVKPRQGTVTSQTVVANTMDTTSHNFSWETFTFGGQGGSSILSDVAIIDEDNIWAVGEIYTADSTGSGTEKYNAVHWDGESWELKRILFSYHGSMIYSPLRSLLAFSEDDIWFEAGIHWNGEEFETVPFNIDFPSHVYSSWGTSSEDFYIVGNEGKIAHYDGESWEKIESGTDVNLIDIYGTQDGKTIWIAGYEDFKPTVLLKITNSKSTLEIEKVFESEDYLFVFDSEKISGGIGSVWTNKNFLYITTWYSIYRKSFYSESPKVKALRQGSTTNFFGLKSKATNINNIFTIGARNKIHHFNGSTFKTYEIPENSNITYYSLDVKTNLTVTVGQKYENGITDKAIITLINN